MSIIYNYEHRRKENHRKGIKTIFSKPSEENFQPMRYAQTGLRSLENNRKDQKIKSPQYIIT